VEAQPRLCALLATVSDGVTIVPFDVAHPLPPADVDMEITELDFVLRAAPDSTPMPYLWARAASLPVGAIALCYGAGDWDGDRSLPPALLAPLCRLAPCYTLMPEATDLPVRNPRGCPFDMADTAALVAGADLVITVGAMGKPTWLLLKSEPDWRWPPLERRSAWYPSMRLYTQRHAGDWRAVLDDVERDLAALSIPALEESI